jgi:hypothetical protein
MLVPPLAGDIAGGETQPSRQTTVHIGKSLASRPCRAVNIKAKLKIYLGGGRGHATEKVQASELA